MLSKKNVWKGWAIVAKKNTIFDIWFTKKDALNDIKSECLGNDFEVVRVTIQED